MGAEPVDHRLHAALEVGADAVHLVDVGDPRDVVLVGLAPHGLRLRLDAGDRVEQRDRPVEHAQRALDLDGEVDVAGGVDDVDAVALPLRGGRGRGDRDAALLLLFHPVHRGGAIVDLADLVGAPRVVEDALGRRRLARVDVGHDPDVAGVLECELAWHGCEWCGVLGVEWRWVLLCGGCCPARSRGQARDVALRCFGPQVGRGKKIGPPGPARATTVRPARVAMCSGSSCCRHAHGWRCSHTQSARRAEADYSRGFDACTPLPAGTTAAAGLCRRRRSKTRPRHRQALEHARGGAQLLGVDVRQRLLPAALPRRALGFDRAPARGG